MALTFSRLVRFENPSGQEHYGEVGEDWKGLIQGRLVPTYDIASPFTGNFQLSGTQAEVAKVEAGAEVIGLRLTLGLRSCALSIVYQSSLGLV